MTEERLVLTDESIDFLFDPGPAEREFHVLVNMIYSDLHNLDEALYWGELDREEGEADGE